MHRQTAALMFTAAAWMPNPFTQCLRRMPRLTTPITPTTGTRHTLAPLYFSISASALEAIIARRIRAIGVAFGEEMGATMVPGVETANSHNEIGHYGRKYGGYALCIQ